jgi:hypothetical protein
MKAAETVGDGNAEHAGLRQLAKLRLAGKKRILRAPALNAALKCVLNQDGLERLRVSGASAAVNLDRGAIAKLRQTPPMRSRIGWVLRHRSRSKISRGLTQFNRIQFSGLSQF